MTYTMGVDIGSITSKCVIVKQGREVVAAEVIQAGTGSDGPKRAVQNALAKVCLQTVSYTHLTLPTNREV